MAKKKDRPQVAILRVTSSSGEQLVACCSPAAASHLVCVGEQDTWLSDCVPMTSVYLDATGAVQLTDPDDVAAIATWLAAAAVWLKSQRMEEGLEDG